MMDISLHGNTIKQFWRNLANIKDTEFSFKQWFVFVKMFSGTDDLLIYFVY